MEFNLSQTKAIETLRVFLSPSYGPLKDEKKTDNSPDDQSDKTDDKTIAKSKNKVSKKPIRKTIDWKSIEYDPPTFLLLGPGGSGKTTIIAHVLNEYKDLSVIFCAFTNKATQVLKKMGGCLCMTIHKLLQLLPYYDKNGELKYSFSVEKLAGKWNHFDVIIFDECSTISKDLYDYIMNGLAFIWLKFGVAIKCIFLGDFWQLPPVGEKSSVVFDMAIKRKIPICKLDKVMRSKTTVTNLVNAQLLQYIEKIKKGIIDAKKFLSYYPYNIVSESSIYIDSVDKMYDIYMELYNKQENTIILTYSTENSNKINRAIQALVDKSRLSIIQRINKEHSSTHPTKETYANMDSNKLSILFNTDVVVQKPILTEAESDDVLSSIISGEFKYSSNVTKVEHSVNKKTGTMIPIENIMFKIGDRCTIDRPINISKLSIYTEDTLTIKSELYRTDDSAQVSKLLDNPMAYLANTGTMTTMRDMTNLSHDDTKTPSINTPSTNTFNVHESISDRFAKIKTDSSVKYSIVECDDYIYNGEIFEVIDVKCIKLVTVLNTKHYNPKHFDTQVLKVIPVDKKDPHMKIILNVDQQQLAAAMTNTRRYEDKMSYQKLVDGFTRCVAKVKYGYCLTVYKSQGSEWNNVLINLPSFYWSLKNEKDEVITTLFKATYTALTRASERLYVVYNDR